MVEYLQLPDNEAPEFPLDFLDPEIQKDRANVVFYVEDEELDVMTTTDSAVTLPLNDITDDDFSQIETVLESTLYVMNLEAGREKYQAVIAITEDKTKFAAGVL